MTANIEQQGGRLVSSQNESNKRKLDDDADEGYEDSGDDTSDTEDEKDDKSTKKRNNKKAKTIPSIDIGTEPQINEWDVDNAALAMGRFFF